MIDATARMLKVEGDEAMTYGEAQGYRGLRELVCHKYDLFEGLKVDPDNILVANGSGNALSLAFSAFVDVGDPIIREAPDLLRHAQHDPPPRRRASSACPWTPTASSPASSARAPRAAPRARAGAAS